MNNDRKLLSDFVAGDRASAKEILSRFAAPLLNHTTHMLKGNQALAEDIVQDTFIKLWKNAEKLLENDGQLFLRAWLFRVATHAVLDQKRKPRHEGDDALALIESGTASVQVMMERHDKAKLAMSYISQLPERQRAAVLMSHFEGMGNSEIGKALDLTVEAVESLLARARRKLREQALQQKEAI